MDGSRSDARSDARRALLARFFGRLVEQAVAGEIPSELEEVIAGDVIAGEAMVNGSGAEGGRPPDLPDSPDPPGPVPPQLVTLSQMAGWVRRSKRTLEWYKRRGLPEPEVEGGGGRAALYDWAVVRPWLEKTFRIRLPATLPDHTRNG